MNLCNISFQEQLLWLAQHKTLCDKSSWKASHLQLPALKQPGIVCCLETLTKFGDFTRFLLKSPNCAELISWHKLFICMTMFSELSIVLGDIFILSCVATEVKSCCSSLMSHLQSIACFWTKSAKSPIQYLSPRPRAQNKHAFPQPHQTKKFSNTSLSKAEFKQHRHPYPSRSLTQCLTVSFGNRQPKRKKSLVAYS